MEYEVIAKGEDGRNRVFTKKPLPWADAVEVANVIRFWDGVNYVTIKESK